MVFSGQYDRRLARCTFAQHDDQTGDVRIHDWSRRILEAVRVVEVQQTVYDPPPIATLQRWREEATPGCEFRERSP